MKRKKKRRIWIAASISALLIIWLAWGNKALMHTEYLITDAQIPEAFSGFRIVQISDLHNALFGEKNEKLLTMMKEAEPDIIVITGDLVDSRHTDTDIALDFVGKATALAPVYYVTGNHEARIYDAFAEMEEEMEQAGVSVLHGETVRLERAGQCIQLIGLDDLGFYARGNLYAEGKGLLLQDLNRLNKEELYTILLSHRPELFDGYVQAGANLVFTGHAHGGQFRLPFLGGFVAPGQGFFPEYDGGLYTDGATKMIVSRGLGNSIIPLRVNNRPELVIAELVKEG